MSLSILEKAYEDSVREKYNMPAGKLDVERGPTLPTLINNNQSTKDTPSKYYELRQKELQEKFNMKGLILEGRNVPVEENAQQYLDRKNIEQNELNRNLGLKLAQGSLQYKNSEFRMWLEYTTK